MNSQYLDHNLLHQISGETNPSYSGIASCNGNSFQSGNACAANAGQGGGQSEAKWSMLYNSHKQEMGQSFGTLGHTGKVKQSFPSGIEDDDILEVITIIFVK